MPAPSRSVVLLMIQQFVRAGGVLVIRTPPFFDPSMLVCTKYDPATASRKSRPCQPTVGSAGWKRMGASAVPSARILPPTSKTWFPSNRTSTPSLIRSRPPTYTSLVTQYGDSSFVQIWLAMVPPTIVLQGSAATAEGATTTRTSQARSPNEDVPATVPRTGAQEFEAFTSPA